MIQAFPNAVFPYKLRVAWSNVKTLSTSVLYINLRALRLNEANSSTAGPSSDEPDPILGVEILKKSNSAARSAACPSGCREFPSPPPVRIDVERRVIRRQIALIRTVAVFSDTNAGKVGLPAGSPSSIETTDPICGAILASPEIGLRPIWIQVRASSWTAAHDRSGPQEAQYYPSARQLRHDALRPADIAVGGRSDERRRPGAFLQIKGIRVAGSARHQNEDDVFRRCRSDARAARATVSIGRDRQQRNTHRRPMLMWRKNRRRLNCGRAQKREPLMFLQSIPKRSFMSVP